MNRYAINDRNIISVGYDEMNKILEIECKLQVIAIRNINLVLLSVRAQSRTIISILCTVSIILMLTNL